MELGTLKKYGNYLTHVSERGHAEIIVEGSPARAALDFVGAMTAASLNERTWLSPLIQQEAYNHLLAIIARLATSAAISQEEKAKLVKEVKADLNGNK